MLPELQTAAGMTFFVGWKQDHILALVLKSMFCVCVCVLNARNKVYG